MRRALASLLVLGAVAFVVVALARAVPPVKLVSERVPDAFPGRPAALAWPSAGEASVGVEGVGLLASRRSDRPVPIASVAKVMTAYIVLHDHPLAGVASGPEIEVTPIDVEIYDADLAAGGSVTAVSAGERLSERQALEALLVPSANNVATLLAKWDAGSESAFVVKMNAEARALGLAGTHYADASGVHMATVSTARDQVRLAMLALKIPAFAATVALRQVTLPVAGVQHSYDRLLGKYGIVGVKPGSTSEAGACFVFAAHTVVGGHVVTVVGAVLGQPLTPGQPSILEDAFHATTALLLSASHDVERFQIARPAGALAWLTAPWAHKAAVRPTEAVSFLGWPGLPVRVRIVPVRHLRPSVREGEVVGVMVATVGDRHVEVNLGAATALPPPSLSWRLTHP
jgi:D-alanyl-D-alanine carboxypeptidase (penicillin-binding protein 5/6)